MTEKRQQQYFNVGGDERVSITPRPYTPLQLHFLARLEHLNQLLQEAEQAPRPDAWNVRLLKKAIYSTLRDCDDQELKEEARAVLAGQARGE